MDYLHRLIRRARLDIFVTLLVSSAIFIGSWWVGTTIWRLNNDAMAGLLVLVGLIESCLIAFNLGEYLIRPLKAVWQGVMHISPEASGVTAPDIAKIGFGGDVVTNLMGDIYQLVSVADKTNIETKLKVKDLSNNFIAQNLPLPLLVLDTTENIKFANAAFADYIGMKPADLIGKNVYMVLDMSFPSEDTFDNWLKQAKVDKATAIGSWERVKLPVRDNHPELLFDLSAYYNRDNPEHNETMVVLFDHTKQYSQDDQAVSFIALSVHELRVPLTLLRGYIEVFEEELDGKLDPSLQSFMEKMRVQAEQLMAFVNNILNVARIDDNQLELKLEAADWASVLKQAIDSVSLRAKVRGITLNCSVQQNMPQVGVDQLSIQEVINNLVDNAIKYSGKSTKINIDSKVTNDGLVETTIQDFGLGISGAILPNLFSKFYRDHHNRSQIGGTGLGLYLSKAIVQAHGGNLWVRSKEGQGSTFGFTLLPYSQIAKEAKDNGDSEIIRGAHGWIKNHSLYRR